MKNTKIANRNIEVKELMKLWLELTRPFHNLTNQQINVLALFLYYHYKFKKEIKNTRVLWKELFDYDTKKLIRDELNMKGQGLQNVLTQLRKKNVIVDNQILSSYIPNMEIGSKSFKVIFNFNVVDG